MFLLSFCFDLSILPYFEFSFNKNNISGGGRNIELAMTIGYVYALSQGENDSGKFVKELCDLLLQLEIYDNNDEDNL